MSDSFSDWLVALENRYGKDLTFQEIRRAVQAISSIYIERRDRIPAGAALSTAGKRAAFALYFAPMHFLIVREIVRSLNAFKTPSSLIIDLGCGTGAAGAAFAMECGGKPALLGVDIHRWALNEAKWTYGRFGLRGRVRYANVDETALPSKASIVAAFIVNELDKERRARLLQNLRAAAKTGSCILIIEPIARRLADWWDDWAEIFLNAGGRADDWRFRVSLPEQLQRMDHAAGLDHRELTGRSLWLPGAGNRN